MALKWETVKVEGIKLQKIRRTKVPGGWLIHENTYGRIIFYPDPNHEWDGNSLD